MSTLSEWQQETATKMEGRAFPSTASKDGQTIHGLGLTKRELFAAMAMQGLLANEQTKPSGMSHDAGHVARRAAQHAEALVAELAK